MNCSDEESSSDPEDILETSLQTLYSYAAITYSSAGSLFSYLPPHSYGFSTLQLKTPDTNASNWSLHASSIWVAAVFLADHIHEIDFSELSGSGSDSHDVWDSCPRDLNVKQGQNHAKDRHDQSDSQTRGPPRRLRILELGAGAGLPGIAIAKYLEHHIPLTAFNISHLSVTLSDYPDTPLIKTLEDNIIRNGVEKLCRVVPHAWGEETSSLLQTEGSPRLDRTPMGGFDLIVAADTLWNPDHHRSFCHTLQLTLKREAHSRVRLVAGLHTGRHTLNTFLHITEDFGFAIDELQERDVISGDKREWSTDRNTEMDDEHDRRQWVLCVTLKWKCNFPLSNNA